MLNSSNCTLENFWFLWYVYIFWFFRHYQYKIMSKNTISLERERWRSELKDLFQQYDSLKKKEEDKIAENSDELLF